ncbi:MAG: SH3 domain-containing protein [Planctomycetes bacterium]|nr:SH3 domain-containing protein [Planctomycetota bacterium]
MARAWCWSGRALAAAACAVTLVGAVAWAAEAMKVVEREAAVRRDKKSYSPKVATVHEGDDVTVLATEEPWIRVDFKGVTGWLSQSSVTPPSKFVPSTDEAARGTRATMQSAAKRGFNPEVEAKYRESNPDLNAAYKLLDEIEKRTLPEEKILRFLEQGKLIEAGGGR